MAQDFTRVFNHLHFHLGLILWCRTNYSMHGPDQGGRGRTMRRDVRENALPVSTDAKSYKIYRILNSFFAQRRRTFLPFVCLREPKSNTIPVRLRMMREGSSRVSGDECQRITTWASRVWVFALHGVVWVLQIVPGAAAGWLIQIVNERALSNRLRPSLRTRVPLLGEGKSRETQASPFLDSVTRWLSKRLKEAPTAISLWSTLPSIPRSPEQQLNWRHNFTGLMNEWTQSN